MLIKINSKQPCGIVIRHIGIVDQILGNTMEINIVYHYAACFHDQFILNTAYLTQHFFITRMIIFMRFPDIAI